MWLIVAVALASIRTIIVGSEARLPIVIGTWGFEDAAQAAWDVIRDSSSLEAALDAVHVGCARCEVDRCDGTVGFGGSPDENGETRLDAMIMDGNTGNVGAVGSMGRIKSAASVARHVLEHTKHTLLVGDLATRFAVQMGFREEPLETEGSFDKWKRWKTGNCQPNFWMNVTPDPTKTCGPYSSPSAKTSNWLSERSNFGTEGNHDTIAMVAVDRDGRIAAGTSTNGASFKIPGRVGDSPIPGSGAYADSDVGGAAATGDGDVMMRFLPSFLAVELMRGGASPSIAANTSVERIIAKQPGFVGAVVAVNKEGDFGAACHGLDHFPFSVASPVSGRVRVLRVDCNDK